VKRLTRNNDDARLKLKGSSDGSERVANFPRQLIDHRISSRHLKRRLMTWALRDSAVCKRYNNCFTSGVIGDFHRPKIRGIGAHLLLPLWHKFVMFSRSKSYISCKYQKRYSPFFFFNVQTLVQSCCIKLRGAHRSRRPLL
jgi:hypothetical protein